jgi:predicted nucleotidyltransferase component of viral defense system
MNDETSTGAYHEDSQRFRDALTRTASETGFSERLIEKDYYCSVLLNDLGALFGHGLVFKGGTCLSKVHADFFRLSEDLDFGISLKPDAPYRDRRKAAAPIKAHLAGIATRLPFFSEKEALTVHNKYKHIKGHFGYRSLVTGGHESIQVEFSLREEVLLPSEELSAETMLIDPFTNAAALAPITVCALSLREAYAEKARAALTRPEPAIRDFFDIDSAVRKKLLQHNATDFICLVSQKLAFTEDPVDISTERIESLDRQIETQLKPVLRTLDYEEFALERAITVLLEISKACQRS